MESSFLKEERPRTQRREGGISLTYVFHHDRKDRRVGIDSDNLGMHQWQNSEGVLF